MAKNYRPLTEIYDERLVRAQQRLSDANLSDVARTSGVSRWTLTRLRDGSHTPSMATLDALYRSWGSTERTGA